MPPWGPVFSWLTLFFPCSLLCLYTSLRGEMGTGGELVGLEIGVICEELGQEGQNAGRVF